MLYLEDSQRKIQVYTIPGYLASQCHAKVGPDDQNHFMVLHYIEVTTLYQSLGLSYRLLEKIMQDFSYLRFQNYNPGFWQHLAKKKRLPYQIVLNGLNGELIKKCPECLIKRGGRTH